MQKMKKRNLIFVALLSLVFVASFVSAESFGDFFKGWTDGAAEGIKFLLGNVDVNGADPGEVLFAKLLVFILLFALVKVAVDRVPMFQNQPNIGIIVSLVVSVLAVRFITTEQMINFIWLPYGVMGVLLSTLLPFVIVFYFLEGFDSSLIRKLGWVLYGAIFFGLGYMRWEDLETELELLPNLGLIYLFAGAVAFLIVFFDKQIRNAMFRSSINKIKDRSKRVQAAKLSAKID
ncbi:MAG: hypothetical protein KJ858_05430, partial [Nanoarchaeota archaeon]|nr:hypothetical protein [Nanoarchaeota archaeon]